MNQKEQEPVAWAMLHDNGQFIDAICPEEHARVEGDYTHPLYTHPQPKAEQEPKREWVGLTDEEIKEIVGPWGDTPIKGYTRKLFDQIEAKLKEKNT